MDFDEPGDEPNIMGNGHDHHRPVIKAQPYSWPDPARIPPRQFLFGGHYIRKAVSATVGSGGRGKTTLGATRGVRLACGGGLRPKQKKTPPRGRVCGGA